MLESFAPARRGRRTSSWSRVRAARPRSTCAPATSPTWASRWPPACRCVLAGDIERGGVIAQLVGTVAAARARGAGPAGRLPGQQVPRRPGLVRRRPSGDRGAHRPALAGRGDLARARRATCPRRTSLGLAELAADGRGADSRPDHGRRAAAAAARQFRRSRPARGRARCRPCGSLEPGEPLPALTRPRAPAREQGDPGRPRGPAGAGWDIDILAHARRGGWVLGLCGGYQMLGRSIADPLGLEGPPGETRGLGPARGRHGPGAGQGAGLARRAGARHGRAGARLRDPYGADRRVAAGNGRCCAWTAWPTAPAARTGG